MYLSLEKACDQLKSGNVVAIPTETVYGLAASVSFPKTIEQIYQLKNRPKDNPLIIHIANERQMLQFTKNLPVGTEKLAEHFWPGPLSLVIPIDKNKVPASVRANLSTAAFRVPNHPLTLQVLEKTGPLVMPSANLSGRPSSTCKEHVEEDFGQNFPVLDGGQCGCGVESTILFFRQNKWEIVRLGALSPELFEPILGYRPILNHSSEGKPLCPGQLFRHYSPSAQLFGGGLPSSAVQAIVGFTDRDYPDEPQFFPLGSTEEPAKVAENLYATLRKLDQEGIESAWVDMDFPRTGLFVTVAERLTKAMAK